MNTITPLQQNRARVSVETGHFYADVFMQGMGALVSRLHTVRMECDNTVPIFNTPRTLDPDTATALGSGVSYSFLFDDYLNRPSKKHHPAAMLGMLRDAALEAGLQLDYIAREAAYLVQAAAALAILQKSPELHKAPDDDSHWLAQLRPEAIQIAMQMAKNEPPQGTPGRIYMDIELFGRKEWACPYLASLWHIHRLGGLPGLDFPDPELINGDMPDWERWQDVPPLIQLREDAAPFCADTAYSILPNSFLAVESAADRITTRLSTLTGSPTNLAQNISRNMIYMG
jgi:hypothetical protein